MPAGGRSSRGGGIDATSKALRIELDSKAAGLRDLVVCREGARMTRRRPAERRARPRFEVVGELWGTLETAQALPIVNIGTGGALILSDKPWEVGTVRSIVFANMNEIGRADIRVRHVAAAEGPARGYAVGVQFVSVSPGLAAELARWTGGQLHEVLEK